MPAPRPKWTAHQLWMWLSGLVGSRYDGLHHFLVVQPGVLLRCGQPRVRELEQIRREHGFKTIVCARGGVRHPLRGRWFRKERDFCARAGVRFEHMPFSDRNTPPRDIFDRFIAIMRDPANHPVLVHCEQGIHRTGILCATYRLAVQDWDFDAALRELAETGFHLDDARRSSLIEALRGWSADVQPGSAKTPTTTAGATT